MNDLTTAHLRFDPKIMAAPVYKGGLSARDLPQEDGERPIYKLSANENPLGPATAVVQTIQQHAASVGQYSPLTDERLRQALAQAHQRSLTPDHFFTADGGFEALDMIARCFLQAGDECLICGPTFGVYGRTAKIQGAEVINVPLDSGQFSHDVEGILTAVTPQTRILYLCNPNNPAGTILTAAEMDLLVNNLPDHVLIVADEVYHHYVDRADFPDSIPYVLDGKNLIIIQTFSKAYGMAGLRLGYGITTPAIASYISHIRRTFHINTLTLEAAITALAHPEHVQQSVALVQQQRAWLSAQLTRLNVHYWPSQANFILMRCAIPGQELADQLLRYGLIVRPGGSFGLPECLRMTIGLPEANRAFIAALEAILSK